MIGQLITIPIIQLKASSCHHTCMLLHHAWSQFNFVHILTVNSIEWLMNLELMQLISL